MRIARVIGTVTLNRHLPDLKPGRYLIADTLDAGALAAVDRHGARMRPMPESLVVFDCLGAGIGQFIAVSDGREAALPFFPDPVPVDAYCAAILDQVSVA